MGGRNIRATLKKLTYSSFIHYARWAVIGVSPMGCRREAEPQYLLFESNFNGTWDQYIDAFSEVVPFRMKAIWGTSTASRDRTRRGVQGLHPPQRVIANHYCSAYPGATTSEISSAEHVETALNELHPQLRDPGADAFKRHTSPY